MAFLGFAAGFTFGGHLSNWTMHDLREQLSNVGLCNLPIEHFLQQCFNLTIPDEYLQRRKETKAGACLPGH